MWDLLKNFFGRFFLSLNKKIVFIIQRFLEEYYHYDQARRMSENFELSLMSGNGLIESFRDYFNASFF